MDEAMEGPNADPMPLEEDDCEQEGIEIPVIWISSKSTNHRSVDMSETHNIDATDCVNREKKRDSQKEDEGVQSIASNQQEFSERKRRQFGKRLSLAKGMQSLRKLVQKDSKAESNEEETEDDTIAYPAKSPSDEKGRVQSRENERSTSSSLDKDSERMDQAVKASVRAKRKASDESDWISDFAINVFALLEEATSETAEDRIPSAPPPLVHSETQDETTNANVTLPSPPPTPPVVSTTNSPRNKIRPSIRNTNSTRLLFGSKKQDEAAMTTSSALTDSEDDISTQHQKPKRNKVLMNSKALLSSSHTLVTSTRQLLGSKKEMDDKDRKMEQEPDSIVKDSSDGASDDSVHYTSFGDEESYQISLQEEDIEGELTDLIDDVLLEMSDEEIEEELNRQQDVATMEVDLQDTPEERLVALVDQIDAPCGTCGCDVGCFGNDTYRTTAEAKTTQFHHVPNTVIVTKGSFEGEGTLGTEESPDIEEDNTEGGNMIGSFLDVFFDQTSLDGGREEDTGFETNGLDAYDDFQMAVELLKRRAARQGIGEAHLLEKIRSEHSRRRDDDS